MSIRQNQRTTAVAEAQPDLRLVVFPVPARSSATFTGTTPNAAFIVWDAVGRVAFAGRADASGTAHLVPPTGLPAGLYTVRCGGHFGRLLME